jgi:hypothetical protein
MKKVANVIYGVGGFEGVKAIGRTMKTSPVKGPQKRGGGMAYGGSGVNPRVVLGSGGIVRGGMTRVTGKPMEAKPKTPPIPKMEAKPMPEPMPKPEPKQETAAEKPKSWLTPTEERLVEYLGAAEGVVGVGHYPSTGESGKGKTAEEELRLEPSPMASVPTAGKRKRRRRRAAAQTAAEQTV